MKPRFLLLERITRQAPCFANAFSLFTVVPGLRIPWPSRHQAMPGLEPRPVRLPSYALRETSEVALRNPEKLFFFLISKLLLVESGWEGSWGGHFVHYPLSGQM